MYVSFRIVDLISEKWLQKVEDKWWKKNPKRVKCTNDYDEATTGMVLGNLSGTFFMIAFGIIVGLVTLIYEFFYYKFLREKFERFYERNANKIKSIVSLKFKFNRMKINM